MNLYTGDCLEVMPTLAAESIDAVATDPPYGLGFMGREWDHGVPGPAFWQEMRRLAKPGAHLLAFGGTRTYHRLAVAIEDAGWEIRDCLVWAYASGFPKSYNLEGEWQGWGTALKPAWEPIVLARKPLIGTVAENAARYGTGALNIDATRIGTSKAVPASPRRAEQGPAYGELGNDPGTGGGFDPNLGRWPANVVLTDPVFDGDMPGVVGGGDAGPAGLATGRSRGFGTAYVGGQSNGREAEPMGYGDEGTYSRFFLITKAARSEREPAIAGQLEQREVLIGAAGHKLNPMTGRPVVDIPRENTHPTVKPLELMRHLVRLVTPPRGVVLDPFLGSGTTALAAEMEGFGWVGIEREPEYVAIAEARLNGAQRGLGLA